MCSHAGCRSEHSHLISSDELASQYNSLYKKILVDNVECLNENKRDSGRKIFKPWEERLQREEFLESEEDSGELLLKIPLEDSFKLKGFILVGGEGSSHPTLVKLYRNKPEITLGDVDTVLPEQQFVLTEDESGLLEYSMRAAKFASTSHLSMYFPPRDENVRVYYIGLRGDALNINQRERVVIATYEARAMPQDHKNEIPHGTFNQLT